MRKICDFQPLLPLIFQCVLYDYAAVDKMIRRWFR